jgi:hypothetical protein
MSYTSIVEMAGSASLMGRITASAAALKVPNPDQWIYQFIWRIAASPGWDAKWDSARSSYNINLNPDTGARTDVISDDDILASINAVLNPEPPA